MAESASRSGFSAFLSTVQKPQIALAALTRLRWLAVAGQVTATLVAIGVLKLKLPIGAILGIVLITALSNAVLMWIVRVGWEPPYLVQVVLMLDVFLLTGLLYLTGGPENPFASLYLVHVTMAVIVLGSAWTWVVAATVTGCYGFLLAWHLPLGHVELPTWTRATGSWIALVLVSVLIAVFIGQVIRSLHQRESELATERERASRNEQLAALTTLAAGAAHELNTPLGTIAVVAREMELSCSAASTTDAAESILEDARLIRQEVDRCRTILSRMRLDIGEEVSQRSVVNVWQLVEGLRASLRPDEANRMRIDANAGVEMVHGSPRALEQALLVLLRNAFDASPMNETVCLTIGRREGRVRFAVEDRGYGMSAELLRRAGEPFFTTKQPGKGMGLGLFLVRLVAEQSGATFTIDSQEGRGTVSALELKSDQANNSVTMPELSMRAKELRS